MEEIVGSSLCLLDNPVRRRARAQRLVSGLLTAQYKTLGAFSMGKTIKVAIAGVGNCASSLVQGVEYYRDRPGSSVDGIMRRSIGGYLCSDVEFVAAFDVDRRKVGRRTTAVLTYERVAVDHRTASR